MAAGLDFHHPANLVFLGDGTNLNILNGNTLAQLNSIAAGFAVGGVRIDSANQRVFVCSRNLVANQVQVKAFALAPPHNQLLAYSIPSVNNQPMGGLRLNPANDRFFLVGRQAIIEAKISDGSVVSTFVFPALVKATGYYPAANRFYALSDNSYSANGGHGIWGKLYEFDVTTRQLDSVKMGSYPQNLALDARNGRLVLPNMHSAWMDIVDLQNFPAKDSVDIGVTNDYLALSPDRSAMYIAQRLGGGNLIRYDLGSQSATTFRAGSWPAVVITDTVLQQLYVLNHYESSISVFDTRTDTLKGTIIFPGVDEARGDAIGVMTLDPVNHKLYAAFPELEMVLVGDGQSITADTAFSIPGYHFVESGGIGILQLAVSPDHNRLVVAQSANRRLKFFRTTDFALLDSTNLGSNWPLPGSDLDSEMLFYDDEQQRFWLGNLLINPVAPYNTQPALPANTRFLGYNNTRDRLYGAYLLNNDMKLRVFQADTAGFPMVEEIFLYRPAQRPPVFYLDSWKNELFVAEYNLGIYRHFTLDSIPPVASCPAPVPHTERIMPTSARLTWSAVANADGFLIRGKTAGSANWVQLSIPSGSTTQKQVFGLQHNTWHVWQIRAVCDTTAGPWSVLDSFRTQCTTPDTLWTNNVNSTTAQLHWGRTPGAVGYKVRGRQTGASNWVELLIYGGSTTSRTVQGLQPATVYEWQVRAYCDAQGNAVSSFTPLNLFTTSNGLKLAGAGFSTNMLVYPNPATDRIFIRQEVERPGTLKILDLSGAILLEKEMAATGETSVAIDHLPAGLYQLSMTTPQAHFVEQVMVVE